MPRNKLKNGTPTPKAMAAFSYSGLGVGNGEVPEGLTRTDEKTFTQLSNLRHEAEVHVHQPLTSSISASRNFSLIIKKSAGKKVLSHQRKQRPDNLAI